MGQPLDTCTFAWRLLELSRREFQEHLLVRFRQREILRGNIDDTTLLGLLLRDLLLASLTGLRDTYIFMVLSKSGLRLPPT